MESQWFFNYELVSTSLYLLTTTEPVPRTLPSLYSLYLPPTNYPLLLPFHLRFPSTTPCSNPVLFHLLLFATPLSSLVLLPTHPYVYEYYPKNYVILLPLLPMDPMRNPSLFSMNPVNHWRSTRRRRTTYRVKGPGLRICTSYERENREGTEVMRTASHLSTRTGVDEYLYSD